MSIMALNVREIGERGASEAFDSVKLCSYAKVLTTVVKDRREDEPDEGMTPDELAEKAEKLIEGMRKARR